MRCLGKNVRLFESVAQHKHGVGEVLGPVGLGVGDRLGPVGDGVGDNDGPVGLGVGDKLGPVGLGVGDNDGPVGDGVGDKLGPVGAVSFVLVCRCCFVLRAPTRNKATTKQNTKRHDTQNNTKHHIHGVGLREGPVGDGVGWSVGLLDGPVGAVCSQPNNTHNQRLTLFQTKQNTLSSLFCSHRYIS